jgi:hypothetical protein
MLRSEHERKAAERAEREQHFKEIEASLARAVDLIVKSRREIERSERLLRESTLHSRR